MKLELLIHTCSVCNERFVAPEVYEFSYGEFLLRSNTGHTTSLDALNEPSYKLVSDLIASNPRSADLAETKRSDLLMSMYGEVACDPAPDGSVLVLGAFPPCPRCHSQKMRSWEPLSPPQSVDADISVASHVRWNNLSREQKAAAVDIAIPAALERIVAES